MTRETKFLLPPQDNQGASDNIESVLRYYCDSAPDFVARIERLRQHGRSRALLASVRCLSSTARVLGFAEFAAFADSAGERVLEETSLRSEEQLSLAMEALRSAAATLRPEHSLCWKREFAGATDPDFAPPQRSLGARRLLADIMPLIVEDDALIRQIVQTALIEAGAKEVICARTFEEALDALRLHKPSLVIADWRAEITFGCDIARLIRGGQTQVSADTPIVGLTRQGAPGGFRDAIRTGVDYFLLKPFTRQALLNAVRVAMSKHAQQAA